MKIIIKTKNIRLTESLNDFAAKKINQLEKLLKTFGYAAAQAEVEIGKTTRHHRKGFHYRAECQMRLPGKILRSEARSEDLRLAVSQVKEELGRQLEQYKNKISAKTKRNQRMAKKSFRFASGARFRRGKGQRIREEGI